MTRALLLCGLALAPARPVRAAASPEVLLESGLSAYEEARFDEAVDLLTKALKGRPGWRTALAFRSMCLWTTGDMRGAAADATLGAELKPSSARDFAARGLARFVLRELDPAAEDFVQSARRDKRYGLAYFGMGSVRSTQGRLREALTNLDIAVRLRPRAAAFHVVRGTVREKLKDYGGAISDFGRVLRLSPDFVWARYYRARSHRELKDYGAAIEDFSRFLDRHPDFEEALYLRSNAYFLSGEVSSAVKDLDRVLALNPKRALAYANRGVGRARLGDRDGAMKDLRRAMELDPSRAALIREQLARVEAASEEETADLPPAAAEAAPAPREPLRGIAARPLDGGPDPLPDEKAVEELAKEPESSRPAPAGERSPLDDFMLMR